jgi:uncharacterized membrane protein
MKRRWTPVEGMLFLSVSFTILLITLRLFYYGQVEFLFFVWNLFLAIIPLFISNRLIRINKLNFGVGVLLLCWLLFLPNAPYIITDIFHYMERPPVPVWYDLLLFTSAAWNGLIIGVVSLLQVEEFLQNKMPKWLLNLVMTTSILACAFGIYLGRFLRFNSWDVLTEPYSLLRQMVTQFINPFDHLKTWGFTFLFGTMLWLVFFTIKKLPGFGNASVGNAIK